MKSLTLRSSVALVCALSLAGCGGGSGNLLLAGRIIGLTNDGLVLQNNGGTPLVIAANQPTFSFPTLLGNDEAFNVTVKSSPASADCTVANGAGKTGAYNVSTVVVSCVTHSFELGGSIGNLGNASGLVIINGADRQEVLPGATFFNMKRLNADGSYASGKVAEGAPYGVTILQQPTGRNCTVQNGSGTMGGADSLTSIQVTCS